MEEKLDSLTDFITENVLVADPEDALTKMVLESLSEQSSVSETQTADPRKPTAKTPEPARSCPECGAPTTGKFCPECGAFCA